MKEFCRKPEKRKNRQQTLRRQQTQIRGSDSQTARQQGSKAAISNTKQDSKTARQQDSAQQSDSART
eukprot:494115-Prymnesium_polylepis.1